MGNQPQLDFNLAGQGLMLAPIKEHLMDDKVSEVLINRAGEVVIEKNGKMTAYDVPEFTFSYLRSLFQVIATANNQVISSEHPILYGSLLDGSRVTLVVPPTATDFTLSIRRKVVRDFSLSDYLETDFFRRTRFITDLEDEAQLIDDTEYELAEMYQSIAKRTIQGKGVEGYVSTSSHNVIEVQSEIRDFIVKAIKLRKNIVFSGGTSSGKTTFLNAALKEIDAEDRIITIESPRELELTQKNVVRLEASKGEQGVANISNQALVKSCMRLRPDRIIMGEIIGGEIMDFVAACTTGHEGSITTIHANNPRGAFSRMAGLYKHNQIVMRDEEILSELKAAIDVIIQLSKSHDGRLATMIWYKYGHLKL